MTDRPRLYPGHRHQWTDADIADPLQQNRQIVRCTICEFTIPRSLANLDGAMLNDAVYDEPDTEPTIVAVPDNVVLIAPESAAWVAEPLDDEPDTDTRCPHHTPAGQCLDHQGHAGDHQYPQETQA